MPRGRCTSDRYLAQRQPIALTHTQTNKKTAKLGKGEESNFQRYHIIKFKRLVFNKKGTRHTKKQEIITHLKENNKATKLSLKKI